MEICNIYHFWLSFFKIFAPKCRYFFIRVQYVLYLDFLYFLVVTLPAFHNMNHRFHQGNGYLNFSHQNTLCWIILLCETDSVSGLEPVLWWWG